MPTTTILVTPAQASAIQYRLRSHWFDLVEEGVEAHELQALERLLESVDRACITLGPSPVTGQMGPLWSALYELVHTGSGALHDACLRYWRGRSAPAEIEAAIAAVAADFALLRRLEDGAIDA